MVEASAPRSWPQRIGDLGLALLLLALALWVVMAGHFLATCPDGGDWFGWSVLVLLTLPILERWTLAPWLALGISLASLRPFLTRRRRFWAVSAAVLLTGLALALALGVTEHLLGLRTRCSLGGW